MRSTSTSRWSSSRPTRSASRCLPRRPACWPRSWSRSAATSRSARVIGRIEAGAGAAAKPRRPSAEAREQAAGRGQRPARRGRRAGAGDGAGRAQAGGDGAAQAGPAARKLAAEKGIDLAEVPATGPKGNVTKGDVIVAPGRQGAGRRRPAGAPPRRRRGRRAARPVGPRRRPRGAGPDDPAQEADRRAAEGGAEHRRHAHDLQRGRHDGDDGAARAATRTRSPRSTASSSASWASS